MNFIRPFALVAASVGLLRIIFPASLSSSPVPQATPEASEQNRVAFDAASIKGNKSGALFRTNNLLEPGGYFRATNWPLRVLIAAAYQLTPAQSRLISGAPIWIDSEHFDIEAKTEGNPEIRQKRLMLQALLADRFKLIMHHEIKQLPVYALVMSKTGRPGPQLAAHSDETKCLDAGAGPPKPNGAVTFGCGGFIFLNNSRTVRVAGANVSLGELAAQLSRFVDHPVIDQTRLTGAFDINFETSTLPLDAPPPGVQRRDDQSAAEIFTALQEQLGLKLESQTGPVDVFVVDHIEEPSPN